MTAIITTPAAFAGDDASTKSTPNVQPPVAKRVLKETQIHGDTLKDEYF
jgi:hypothetical protein